MTDRHRLALVRRDGPEETVRTSESETVLEAAESSRVALPFGCRRGACGTCVGRLVDGSVAYERQPRALKGRRREAGYVLCCIALPRSDCRIEVGADVQADLVSNPWE